MVEKHEPDKQFVYPYWKQKWYDATISQSEYIWCLICKKSSERTQYHGETDERLMALYLEPFYSLGFIF